MQKVFRHTILAQKQVKRRAAKRAQKNIRDNWRNERDQAGYARKEVIKDIKDARQARREDYELGPLAPRRDVGDNKDIYGTISLNRIKGPKLWGKEKWDILKFWGGKMLNIKVGDRVVILEGRDKGKIGKLTAIDEQRAEVVIGGLNMMDIKVPSYMIHGEEEDQSGIRSHEQPVSMKSIRLVTELNGRDVIVKELASTRPMFINGRVDRERFIPGLNHRIPWPEVEEPTFEDNAADTLRMEVEIKTFVPSLLTPPMPASVIDELRNRYGIFRTRHEPEYLAKKQAEEDEKLAKKATAKKMRTPLNEANRKLRKERKKLGKGKLTPDMLEKIGQVIAGKRNAVMGAVGVSKEPTAEPVTA